MSTFHLTEWNWVCKLHKLGSYPVWMCHKFRVCAKFSTNALPHYFWSTVKINSETQFYCSDPFICIMRTGDTWFLILLAVKLQSAVMMMMYDSTVIFKIQYPLRRTEQTEVPVTLPRRIRQWQITGNLNLCVLEFLPYFRHCCTNCYVFS